MRRASPLLRWPLIALLCCGLLLLPANAHTQQAQSQLYLPLVTTAPPRLAVFTGVADQPDAGRIDIIAVGGAVSPGAALPFRCEFPAWAPKLPRIACVLQGLVDGKSRYIAGRIGTIDGQVAGIDGGYWQAIWSPDGAQVLFGGERLTVLDVDGRRETLDANGTFDPSWSPDGSAIAYASSVRSGVTLLPLGNRQPVTFGTRPIYSYAWSPDGAYLAIHEQNAAGNPTLGGDLVLVELATGTTRRVAEQILSFSWSPDSSTIAIERRLGETRRIVLIGLTGAELRDLGEGIGVEWAPNGKRLVLLTGGSGAMIDLETHAGYPLGTAYAVVWSPDSQTVAYVSEINGAQVTIADITGQGVLVEGLRFAGGFQWSPDSQWVAFTSVANSEPGTRLVIARRDTGATQEHLFSAYVSGFQWLR